MGAAGFGGTSWPLRLEANSRCDWPWCSPHLAWPHRPPASCSVPPLAAVVVTRFVEITRQARSRIGPPYVCLVWRYRTNANTVIAICATVIAVASLGVSVYAVWATRKHNRLSVQPLLGLATRLRVGDTAGLLLSNVGLGPAKITNTELTLDDDRIGDFSKPYVDKLRNRLSVRPHATTLGGHPFLDTD